MKITYVSHACMVIDTGSCLIATDPWFDAPAFCDQWHVFPKPVDTEPVASASVILISHPHEDHLHEPTLRRVCREPKTLFYPFYWYPETIVWLRSMQLGEIVEARSGKAYEPDPNSKVTFIGAPGQNSIIVIESRGQVLVNINDALHSEATSLIETYVRHITRRWRKIDVVFCGFGGASYYPNTLHSSDKDDRAIARLREQLFVHNFCRIVNALSPRLAIPFAADFVLLSPHQRWINEIRFTREDIPLYYARHFADNGRTTVCTMYPGDTIVDGVLELSSPYRPQLKNGRLDHLISVQYPQDVSAFGTTERSLIGSAAPWESRLASHLDSQVKFHSRAELEGVCFSLRLRDLIASGWFNIRCTGARFQVVNAAAPSVDSIANIETTTSVIETSIQSDWGGDALTIGYACDVTVLDTTSAGKARLCVSLLTRYPRPSSYALRHPIRTADYLCQSAPMIAARLRNKIRFRATDDNLMTSGRWLTGDVEAIRRAYQLPDLNEMDSAA
jgi:L-ascorbate metabolism protein UlaG (beta-lactamase superfamily)